MFPFTTVQLDQFIPYSSFHIFINRFYQWHLCPWWKSCLKKPPAGEFETTFLSNESPQKLPAKCPLHWQVICRNLGQITCLKVANVKDYKHTANFCLEESMQKVFWNVVKFLVVLPPNDQQVSGKTRIPAPSSC